MTLTNLIARCNERRPSAYTKEDITSWINEVEQRAVEQVFNRAEDDETEYVPLDPDSDTALLIPDEFCGVYEYYVYAMQDYINAEFDRYNNDAAMYEARFKDFASYYRRTHMPKERL